MPRLPELGLRKPCSLREGLACMNKIPKIIGVSFGVVVLGTVLAFSGLHLSKMRYEEAVLKFSSHLPKGWSLSSARFERSLFRTKAFGQLTYKDQDALLKFDLKCDVSHIPGFDHGLYLLSQKAVIVPEGPSLSNTLALSDSPLAATIDSKIYLNGLYGNEIELSALQFKNADFFSLPKGLKISVAFNKDFLNRFTLTVPNAVFDDTVVKFDMKDLVIDLAVDERMHLSDAKASVSVGPSSFNDASSSIAVDQFSYSIDFSDAHGGKFREFSRAMMRQLVFESKDDMKRLAGELLDVSPEARFVSRILINGKMSNTEEQSLVRLDNLDLSYGFTRKNHVVDFATSFDFQSAALEVAGYQFPLSESKFAADLRGLAWPDIHTSDFVSGLAFNANTKFELYGSFSSGNATVKAEGGLADPSRDGFVEPTLGNIKLQAESKISKGMVKLLPMLQILVIDPYFKPNGEDFVAKFDVHNGKPLLNGVEYPILSH